MSNIPERLRSRYEATFLDETAAREIERLEKELGRAYQEAEALRERVKDLEAMAREMVMAIPGGHSCDPQRVADTLREIAQRHGVKIED